MLKNLFITAALGVSTLGVMAAHAAAVGPYITGQLGYADTHMGSKTDLSPYKNVFTSYPNNLSDNGVAARLAVGYQFNQHFAVELGSLQMGGRKADASLNPIAKLGQKASLRLSQNVSDLAFKGMLPLTDKFNAYGKVGIAYLTTDIDAAVNVDNDGTIIPGTKAIPITVDLNDTFGVSKHKIAPEVVVGASYNITPSVPVDISWTHVQPIGKNRPGNIDFLALGVGYNFG